jgi:preprotein translocase subunit SecA
MLCEMNKLTKWYLETEDWVVAEKLDGGPFVVSKTHQTELSDEEWEEMERVVSRLFNEFEIRVMMNLVEDHWHGHILTGNGVDLSNE